MTAPGDRAGVGTSSRLLNCCKRPSMSSSQTIPTIAAWAEKRAAVVVTTPSDGRSPFRCSANERKRNR